MILYITICYSKWGETTVYICLYTAADAAADDAAADYDNDDTDDDKGVVVDDADDDQYWLNLWICRSIYIYALKLQWPADQLFNIIHVCFCWMADRGAQVLVSQQFANVNHVLHHNM